ncbi:MAG: hypothetical protein REI12_14155 [Pedobacter sp.]|nr:hypothetical protein [Pedobacter sp.]
MKQIFKQPKVQTLAAAVMALGMTTGASQSWAATAASATVRNVVTVSYNNAANTPQTPLVAAVDVTVNLVQAAATLSAPTDLSTVPGTNAVYTYTITNGSNGIATYGLATGSLTETNISSSSAAPSTATISLGATTVTTAFNIPTTAGGAVTGVVVPRDGTADTSVNGIANGDTVIVRVGATDYIFTASAVTDVQVPASPATGSTNMTTTMTLTLAAGSPVASGTVTAAVGTLIAERQTFTVAVTPGTMTSTSDATIDTPLTATLGSFTSTDSTLTTVATVGLSVAKLVRNVTTPVTGTGSATNCGVTAYAGGVSGKAGDVLEYLIVVSKSASTSNATQVKISDPLPPFTTLNATSLAIDADGEGAGAFAAIDSAADNGDAGEADTSTVYFYPGSGGNDSASGLGNGTGGTIGASGKVCMRFSVTIQ